MKFTNDTGADLLDPLGLVDDLPVAVAGFGALVEREDSFRLWLRRWWPFKGVPVCPDLGDTPDFGDKDGERGSGLCTIGVMKEESVKLGGTVERSMLLNELLSWAAGADRMENDESVDVGMPKEGSNWIMRPPWDMSFWQPAF